MNVNEILKIEDPTYFFEGSEDQIKSKYYQLSKLWHPDKGETGNSDIFIHITKLYKLALQIVTNNYSKVLLKNAIEYKGKDGKLYRINYSKIHDMKYYKLLISKEHITYVFNNNDLANNFIYWIKELLKGKLLLKNEFERFFPKIKTNFITIDNLNIIILKNENLVLLKDVLSYYNNQIPIKHSAWIINSLYNLICYFKFNDICHNSILCDTYFINCEKHYGILMGGWEHTIKLNQPLKSLPRQIFEILPRSIKNKPKGHTTIDSESIKALGREILGDRSGSKLLHLYPKLSHLITFLKLPSENNPVDDYQNWEKILKMTFGPRKFIEMDCGFKSVYLKEGV